MSIGSFFFCFFRLVRFGVRLHGPLFLTVFEIELQIGGHVNEECQQHKGRGKSDQNRYHMGVDLWKCNQREHDTVQNDGADLAAPHGTFDVLSLCEEESAECKGNQFFDTVDHNQDCDPVIFVDDAEQHCKLHGLVSNRIDDLPEIRDHIAFPGNEAIHDIRECGDGNDHNRPYMSCNRIGTHVYYDKNGYQKNSYIGKNIRNRKNVFFVKMHKILRSEINKKSIFQPFKNVNAEALKKPDFP